MSNLVQHKVYTVERWGTVSTQVYHCHIANIIRGLMLVHGLLASGPGAFSEAFRSQHAAAKRLGILSTMPGDASGAGVLHSLPNLCARQ